MGECATSACENDTHFENNTNNEMVCVMESSPGDFLSSTMFQVCIYSMYGVVFIVALLGNGLVCFVVHSSPKMKTVTNYFIVNLAVGDILMTVFCVPFSFVPMLILRYWPFGGLMCKIVNFTQAVSVLVSAYTLLAISTDRYMAIMHPLRPRLGKATAKLVVAAVWGGAIATAVPIPIVTKPQRPSPWHEACELDICQEEWSSPAQSLQYTYALLGLQFVLPLTVLVGSYARIAHVVLGKRPPGEAHDARDSRMQRSKIKMVKMMVTVVAVFIICWLPLNIFIVLWMHHEADEAWGRWPGMPYVWFASHWLAMSHSCYNPLIYCYMNDKYRRGFKQVLSGMLCYEEPSCPNRSSLCDGVPMSELVGTNTVAALRGVACSRCRQDRSLTSVEILRKDSGKCSNCNSMKKHLLKNGQSARATRDPVRAVSISGSITVFYAVLLSCVYVLISKSVNRNDTKTKGFAKFLTLKRDV